ncbi:sigma 54 modulation/S30EA ribosomal C-terminal domain-containing protein, partial [Streptococcus pyogenes]
IRRNKTKIEKKHRQKVPVGQIFTADLVEEVEEEVKVVRTKQVDLKPMDLEEAVLQLELLGHDFFIYTDAKDGTTNVLYKREEGDLGLLEVR